MYLQDELTRKKPKSKNLASIQSQYQGKLCWQVLFFDQNQAAVDEMKYPRDNNLPVLDALSANCIQQSLPETLFVSATCYREV